MSLIVFAQVFLLSFFPSPPASLATFGPCVIQRAERSDSLERVAADLLELQRSIVEINKRVSALIAEVEPLPRSRRKADRRSKGKRNGDAPGRPGRPGPSRSPESISVTFDGVGVTFDAPAETDWSSEAGWRFCVRRQAVGDSLVIVFLEQFGGIDATRITWCAMNSFGGTGAFLFDEMQVEYGPEMLYQIGKADRAGMEAIQVRGVFARRHYVGPNASELRQYNHIAPAGGYPDWVEEVCLEGLERERSGSLDVGPYRIGDPGVYGSSSLNGSHGGWKVAPWHMGPEGWQRASRSGYMWAEVSMFDTLDRSPIAVFDRETMHPLNLHQPYWPGRANAELDGFAPDPDSRAPYLPELERFEAHAYSHLHRETAAAAMLAHRDAFARWLLVEVYWHDISMWLDGAQSGTSLSKPARQVIEEVSANTGWSAGGRGFAHSVRAYLWARVYFPPEARNDRGIGSDYDPSIVDSSRGAGQDLWSDLITELVVHVTPPNGVIHRWKRDDRYPEIAPAARAREVDLFYPNFEALGLPLLAAACRKTMAPMDGVSVAESFDPRFSHWSGGKYAKPSYYNWYDLIRGDSLHLLDLSKRWSSPSEQLLSMVPPSLVGAAPR